MSCSPIPTRLRTLPHCKQSGTPSASFDSIFNVFRVLLLFIYFLIFLFIFSLALSPLPFSWRRHLAREINATQQRVDAQEARLRQFERGGPELMACVKEHQQILRTISEKEWALAQLQPAATGLSASTQQ